MNTDLILTESEYSFYQCMECRKLFSTNVLKEVDGSPLCGRCRTKMGKLTSLLAFLQSTGNKTEEEVTP